MSKIEWTDETWNPVTGCNDVQFHPDRLRQPLRWEKPRMVFVNSISDLFHEAVTDEQLDQIFAVMALTPQHTYQVLTKRPERMLEYLTDANGRFAGIEDDLLSAIEHQAWVISSEKIMSALPLPNVWLGVTVENQKAANDRIPLLLETPAAVRFLSCEPLLEDVDLNVLHWENITNIDCLRGKHGLYFDGDCEKIDWVIVGGESGHKARSFDIRWARSIINQCRDAGVSVFVKQLGTRNNWTMNKMGASTKGSNPDEWPEDLRVREYPKVRVAEMKRTRL